MIPINVTHELMKVINTRLFIGTWYTLMHSIREALIEHLISYDVTDFVGKWVSLLQHKGARIKRLQITHFSNWHRNWAAGDFQYEWAEDVYGQLAYENLASMCWLQQSITGVVDGFIFYCIGFIIIFYSIY